MIILRRLVPGAGTPPEAAVAAYRRPADRGRERLPRWPRGSQCGTGGGTVAQTRPPPPRADPPAAAPTAPDQAGAVPEPRPACRPAARRVTAASSPVGR